MKANQLFLVLLASVYMLAFTGCQRGPNIVKFDKVVYDIPALSAMTYEQAKQKLGAPTATQTGQAGRGLVRNVDWTTPDKTMSLWVNYDEGIRLPYTFTFFLNGTFSTEEELRKATNLQQNDSRLDVRVREAPRETRIRREGETDIVFYDKVHVDVIARQNTPAKQEFERKFVPQPP